MGGLIFALASPWIALAGLALLAVAAGGYLSLGTSLLVNLAAPHVRGSTAALSKVVGKISTGVVPVFTGVVSDAIGGDNSLRFAIVATVALYSISALCYFMAGRRAPALGHP